MVSNQQLRNELRRATEFLSARRSEARCEPRSESLAGYWGATLNVGFIDWNQPGPRENPVIRFKRVPANLFFRFASLAEGPDEDIVAFAGRWGPLANTSEPSERIAKWREDSRLAAALLLAAAALAGGSACDAKHLAIINERAFPGRPDILQPDYDPLVLRSAIVAALNDWFNAPGMRRSLVEIDDSRRLRLRFATRGLAGTIVHQLARQITGAHHTAVCDACGRVFTPQRHPTRGVRQYCKRKKCRQAALRDAARDYRGRKRAAQRPQNES